MSLAAEIGPKSALREGAWAFAISLIEFSIWSRISDDLVTALAWDIMDDHSESEGRCFGGFTPSFSDASEIVLEEDMATGMSFL